MVRIQGGEDLLLELGLAGAVLPGDHDRGNAGPLGPLQGVDPGLAGDHQGQVSAVDPAGLLGVDQRLEIGAAAGDENRDLYHAFAPFPQRFSPGSSMAPRALPMMTSHRKTKAFRDTMPETAK